MSALLFDGLSVGFACFKDETSATCNNGEQRTQIKPASITPLILLAIETANLEPLKRAAGAFGYLLTAATIQAFLNHLVLTLSGRKLKFPLHLLSAFGRYFCPLISLVSAAIRWEKETTFAPGVALKITGAVPPATDQLQASVELTWEGISARHKIKGFLLPGSDHVVDAVLRVANNLGKQPIGAVGRFVLFPTKA